LLLALISPFHYTANRYIFISLPSWLILAALTAVTLAQNGSGTLKVLALGISLLLIAHPISEDAMYYLYQNGNRDNWRAAFAYIEQHRRPSDLVASGDPRLANYYLSAPSSFISKLNLDEVEAGDQRVWFVEDLSLRQKFPKPYHWLSQNARLVSVYDVSFQARIFTMRVYLFDPVDNAERAKDEQ
jgi:hypothetical protein